MKSLLFLLFTSAAFAEPVGRVTYTNHSDQAQGHSTAMTAASSAITSGANGEAVQQAKLEAAYAQKSLEKSLATYRESLAQNLQSSIDQSVQKTRAQVAQSSSSSKVDLPSAADIIAKAKGTAVPRTIDLSSIPDPSSLPYHFQSGRSDLVRTYTDLYKISPQFPRQQTARTMGLQAAEGADQSYASGDQESGRLYQDIAVGMLDVAIGIDPVTGTARAAYELVVGKNLVTGLPLTNTERTFAFVGVVTAGQSRNIQKAAGVALKLANHSAAVQPIIRAGERLAVKVGEVAHGFIKSHRITHIEKAIEANTRLGYAQPPYDLGTRVVHFITTRETKWVRFHTNEFPTGRWMVKAGEVKGLSPQQIADKLNLPTLPTHYNVVTIPEKIPMSRGMTHLNHWENGLPYTMRGQVQYRIEAKSIEASWYGQTKVLNPGGIR